MIVYKRPLRKKDLTELRQDEELIFYRSETVAICINIIGDCYLLRRKRIADNEMIEELRLDTIDEIITEAMA
jgi:hypothetical protein